MKLSFTSRIILTLLVIFFIGTLGGVVAFIGAGDAAKKVDEVIRIHKTRVLVQELIGKLDYESSLMQYLAEADTGSMVISSFKRISGDFAETIEKINAESFLFGENERSRLVKAIETHNAFSALYGKVILRNEPVRISEMREMKNMLDRTRSSFHELSGSFDTRLFTIAENSGNDLRKLGLKLIVVFFLAVIISLVTGMMFVKTYAMPLQRLMFFANQVGKGDFEQDVQIKGADSEVADLIESFQEMAMKLKLYRDDLVKSEQMRSIDLIASGVSHELNNPLMIVSGNAEYVRSVRRFQDDDLNERMATIISECDRMASIVKKLSAIRKIVTDDYTGRVSSDNKNRRMLDIEKST
jgi:signal transduction histidine kinase